MNKNCSLHNSPQKFCEYCVLEAQRKAAVEEGKVERVKMVKELAEYLKDFHTGYGDYVLNSNEVRQLLELLENNKRA